MRFLWIVLLTLQMFVLQAVDVTVWVHGTYPALRVLSASWCPVRSKVYVNPGLTLAKKLPKNYYHYQLSEFMHNLDPILYNHDHFYTYGWHSSNVRPKQRIKEGKKLYHALQKLINKYKKKHEDIMLRVIGFSHGGNVILNMASHLPFKQKNQKLHIILIGTPVQESARNFINNPYITKAYSFYSDGDWIQKIDVQKFHHNCPKDAPFLSQRVFKDSDNVQQISFTLNGKKIGHTGFRGILKYLPDMMSQIEKKLVDLPHNETLKFDYVVPGKSKKRKKNK